MAETAMYTETAGSVPFAIVAATSTENNLALNRNRQYTVYHTGLQSDGTTAALGAVFFRDAATVTASYAAATGKGVLIAGQSMVFGPGLTALYFKTAAASPMLVVNTGVHQHLAGQE